MSISTKKEFDMKHLLSIALLASLSLLSIDTLADRPCKTIAETCMSAGVIQKGAPKNAIISHCIRPVIAGRRLPGVNIEPAVIQECRAKIAAR